tara:strand:+ start:172 stop:561 length:390 start_codon:yes stop_codon:yes gene_type:complete
MSLPISALALVTATEASNVASENKKKICELTVNSFNNKLSTIEQKQGYADCVETLYPQKMSVENVLGLKILFMTALIIFVLSVVYNFSTRSRYEDIEDAIIITIFFNLSVWTIIVMLGATISGLFWVFK